MTDVEYTEKAIEQLEDLETHIAERIIDKLDEATEFTEYRLEKLGGHPYYKSVPGTIGRL